MKSRVAPSGYLRVLNVGGKGRHQQAHRVIVETVLGYRLPAGVEIHHVNERKADNANANLVVLQSHRDHLELHRKMRVRAVGGDPWRDRLCVYCGPQPTSAFDIRRNRQSYRAVCRSCGLVKQREWWRAHRADNGVSI